LANMRCGRPLQGCEKYPHRIRNTKSRE
jgi:hypothetical protein